MPGRVALDERADFDRLDVRSALAGALELAAADVPQPAADGVRRLDVDDEEVLLEPGRSRDDLARVVEDDRVPVEDQLVLPPDEVAEREERARVAGAGHEHLLALLRLADVVRRRRQVHEQLRAREREIGRRWAWLPDVLADRRPDERVPETDEQQVAALGEVPMLIEDAVVREELLPVDASDLTVGAYRACVCEVAVEPRRADEGDEPGRRGGRLCKRLARRLQKAGAEQQVLRRIAGHRELGEEDEVRAGRSRLAERADDLVAVPAEVADDDIQLCERDPHRGFGPLSPSFRLIVEN